MKLDTIVLRLFFKNDDTIKRGALFSSHVLFFKNRKQYEKYINNNLKFLEEQGLYKWEFYYAKLMEKG